MRRAPLEVRVLVGLIVVLAVVAGAAIAFVGLK